MINAIRAKIGANQGLAENLVTNYKTNYDPPTHTEVSSSPLDVDDVYSIYLNNSIMLSHFDLLTILI